MKKIKMFLSTLIIVCATMSVYAITYDEALQQSNAVVKDAKTAQQLIGVMTYVSQINSRVTFDFSLTQDQRQNYITVCNSIGSQAENRLKNEFPSEYAQLGAQLNAQVMATMQSMMMQNMNCQPTFSPTPVHTSQRSAISYKRTCSIHRCEYDIRFGGCPQCKAPDYGNGRIEHCIRCGTRLNTLYGCPKCGK